MRAVLGASVDEPALSLRTRRAATPTSKDSDMTDPRIIRLRIELYAAAQTLKGDDLKAFTDLVREIAYTLDLELSPAEMAKIA